MASGGLFFAARPVLARTRRFLDWRACKPKVGLRTSSHTAVRLRCELAIHPVPGRWLDWRLESGWLPSRAASTSVLPGACRPQRCPSARSARTRPNATFPPSSARASASSRRFCRVLLSLVRPAHVSLASPARVDGDTAGLSRRGRSPRSFAGGARVRRHSGRREVVAHDARSERGLGLGHPLLLPAARPGGTCGGVSFHWGRGDGVRVG